VIMIDLRSALYLEMQHAHEQLPGWRQLTTGVPASVREDVRSRWVGTQIARMQGLEQGMTAASTLHLFADLHAWLADSPVTVFIDEFIYPVARFGIEKLAAKGIRIVPYRHQQAEHLEVLMDRWADKRTTPVVLTDGWCPQCGQPAPLPEIAVLLEKYDGRCVIDDTQAFGLLGRQCPAAPEDWPYGRGGGGLLRWSAAPPDRMISITSLAKSFGVPIAVISGSESFIREFRGSSRTMDHCSPPSIAHLSAAIQALETNRTEGDCRRQRLFGHVLYFKQRLWAAGIRSGGGFFPVQHLDGLARNRLLALHRWLGKEGVQTVLTKGHRSPGPQLSLLFRAGHRDEEIGMVTEMIIRFYRKKQLYHGNEH
jgi:8-amino-7-oxononanoate synthase